MSFKDRFSALERSQMDSNGIEQLSMHMSEVVADAPEAVKERLKFCHLRS
jgi:hypothetical protein